MTVEWDTEYGKQSRLMCREAGRKEESSNRLRGRPVPRDPAWPAGHKTRCSSVFSFLHRAASRITTQAGSFLVTNHESDQPGVKCFEDGVSGKISKQARINRSKIFFWGDIPIRGQYVHCVVLPNSPLLLTNFDFELSKLILNLKDFSPRM